ncbi:ABC transporter ATP-binding protein [Phytohabitans houttuyneae]|uniref:Putative nitrate ABC transporter, ATP-binding protein n=1 Tax=Phytohabitans houttuyneae TaxID=1076126 RepID=A0A6V8K6I5_9ACTN|nr:ABC transporter ATP-binding protein [Phytohabitans houttuyneae]GFJ80812.1 putative nitrate ABC transporter, ATP-binding protein [Phytohabitans houttuyneae]
MIPLRMDAVDLGYDGGPVVRGLDLDVKPGEVLAIAGASGCGKSTVLRALAGLLPPRAGTILADGVPVRGPSPDRALVFQDDALLPWRTARRNVELPLAIRGTSRAERRARADDWLARVGLAGQERRLPGQLSGGMRQRVQLARTLAGSPRVVLMDEPFGALDAQTRAAMQRLLVGVLATTPATVVFVTHDVDEAVLLGDRVAVLAPDGVCELVDVPYPREMGLRDAPEVAAARGRVLSALS